jgi:YHS domain-containing protein
MPRNWLRSLTLTLTLTLRVATAHADGAINTNSTAYAIGGYDPVAYFTDAKPVMGKPDLEASAHGARWLFASPQHRALFLKDPEHYLPAYDGYCAFGVSRGYLVKIDPQAFTIRDNHLYLNYSLDIRSQWLSDVQERIRTADKLFPTLKH